MFQNRRFLEVNIAGTNKALYIPAGAVLTYELVPEGKNENFPDAKSFIRYDFGEGINFALTTEEFDKVKEVVTTEGFLELHLIDDSPVCIRNHLIQAIQEVEDEGVEATRLSINTGGQVGSLFVKEPFASIKEIRGD